MTEDDLALTDAAAQIEGFTELLEYYFETSDPDLRFQHLANREQFEQHTLLGYCCSKGFVHCVRHLLAHYTEEAALEPWMEWADPCWLDP